MRNYTFEAYIFKFHSGITKIDDFTGVSVERSSMITISSDLFGLTGASEVKEKSIEHFEEVLRRLF